MLIVVLEWAYGSRSLSLRLPWSFVLLVMVLWGLSMGLCFTYWSFSSPASFQVVPGASLSSLNSIHILHWLPYFIQLFVFSGNSFSFVGLCLFFHLCEWSYRHAVWILCLEFHLGHSCWGTLPWMGRIWRSHVLVCCCYYLCFYIGTCISGAR